MGFAKFCVTVNPLYDGHIRDRPCLTVLERFPAYGEYKARKRDTSYFKAEPTCNEYTTCV